MNISGDGVYFNIYSDPDKQCIFVLIGVTEQGRKEFIAIDDGYREFEQSWRELLMRVKAQGLKYPPKIGGCSWFLECIKKNIFDRKINTW